MKLDLGPNQTNTYSGLVNDQSKEAEPFKFLGVKSGMGPATCLCCGAA